jgi:hypothetical protein
VLHGFYTGRTFGNHHHPEYLKQTGTLPLMLKMHGKMGLAWLHC